jgi:hypothetical protein
MERIRTRCASLWILALVLVVAVGVLVAPATALATGTLAGTVWKAAVPGEKLPGIRVFCYQAVGDANVYVSDMLSTTPDGAYSFTLPAGNYRLMAQDSSGVYSTMFLDGSVRGYDPSPASYAVSDGVFNYQHFYMKLGARFEITAEDWDGTPIPGMYVQAFRNVPGGSSVFFPDQLTTGANGKVAWSDQPDGDWFFQAYDPAAATPARRYMTGRFPEAGLLTVAAGATETRSVRMQRLPSVGFSLGTGPAWFAAPAGLSLTLIKDPGNWLASESVAFYRVDGGSWVKWTTASTTTLLTGQSMHTVEAYAQLDPPPLGDPLGGVGPAAIGQFGILGPQPGVSKPSGATSVRKNRTATYRGTLGKRVKNHSGLVLRAYRLEGGVWVLRRTKTVKVHTPRRRGKPTYSGSIKFTSKGSWRVVAHYNGDGYWWWQDSSGRSVKVR